MKLKILYMAEDCIINRYNSVRDILFNIINHPEMNSYQQIIFNSDGHLFNPIEITYTEGVKTYSASQQQIKSIFKNNNYSILNKLICILKRVIFSISRLLNVKDQYSRWENNKYFKKVLKKEEPDIVIQITFSPNRHSARICKKRNIPYISMLYDTFIERPYINKEKAFKTEQYAIENSVGYFVPNFFFDGYLKHYTYSNIYEYKLPLLIEKDDVINAYKNTKHNFDFTYFGQIQSFRNGNSIKEIFKKLNISLDIFTPHNKESDDTFIYHPAVTKNELHEIVAGSKYLVAFDNGKPFENYLPSKAYLYVSFTKPVIAFGDNKDSALKKFFKDYPWFYYHDINDTSLDGLKDFLKQIQQNNFDEEIYSKYSEYSPKEALKPITSLIRSTLNK